MAPGIHSSFKPSLLTKTEIDWLSGKAHLSKSYEYKIKSIIKSKLKALYEFELPLILESGLFPEAANLAIFNNHNEATSKATSDSTSLSIKEEEEKSWTGFGDGELNSDTAQAALVKAKVPAPNPGQDLSSHLNFDMEINYYSKPLSNIVKTSQHSIRLRH
jgi:hypothetical protein